MSTLKNESCFQNYIQQEVRFFKSMIRIRSIMTYDPEKLCDEIIRRAEIRWNERRRPNDMNNSLTSIKCTRDSMHILISWNLMWAQNALYNNCDTHDILITPNHLIHSLS